MMKNVYVLFVRLYLTAGVGVMIFFLVAFLKSEHFALNGTLTPAFYV